MYSGSPRRGGRERSRRIFPWSVSIISTSPPMSRWTARKSSMTRPRAWHRIIIRSWRNCGLRHNGKCGECDCADWDRVFAECRKRDVGAWLKGFHQIVRQGSSQARANRFAQQAQTSAEHDDIWVKPMHDVAQGEAERVCVLVENRRGQRVSRGDGSRKVACFAAWACALHEPCQR